jgi:adenine-specific DNA-methyltransferase
MDEAIKPDSPAYKLGFKRVIEVTAERVRRVIKGVPTAKDEKLKDGLGGSFTFCNLGKEISIEKIIAGESLPDYGALANYVFYTATGKSLDRDAALRADYFVGETDLYEVYLIYQPDTTFLRSNESALNDVKLKAIADRGSKKEKLVFATAKYMGQRELSAHNITFCQLPYAIHKVVGA